MDDPFVAAVAENRIYEDLMKKLGVTRDVAKQEMMHYMYCPVTSRAQKRFASMYPKAAEIAASYKVGDRDMDGAKLDAHKRHRVFPQRMQRAETEMFREVWGQCLRDGLAIIPVHDAIYIRKDQNSKRYLKGMIKGVLGQFITIRFDIQYEVVGGPSQVPLVSWWSSSCSSFSFYGPSDTRSGYHAGHPLIPIRNS
jgi:hypothetical protein